MENFYNRLSSYIRQSKIVGKLPKTSDIERALFSFSKKEYAVFFSLVLILIISTLGILQNINTSLEVTVPMRGGSISEGIVGTPRFINPVLALSDADRDLVALVYSGLMRKTIDGELVPDLAEKVDVSKDGLTYTFTLKEKAYFQDGTKVTADDVVFTVDELKDPIIKSPHKGSWDGISVTKVDDKTVKFTLKQSYASFLENTTVGIMPLHLWSSSPIELSDANINPIGSGPYKMDRVNKQSGGTVDSYVLTSFNKFVLAEPYIKTLSLHFYSNEDDLVSAYERGVVDQISSITPENASILKEKNYRVESSALPRIFGLFFNQSQNQIFIDKNVVQAIDQAIDKQQIVNTVLKGYGVIIDNPIPPSLSVSEKLSGVTTLTQEEKVKKVTDMLSKDGWKKGGSGFLEKTTTTKGKKSTAVLEFSISTANTPDLSKAAELIRQDLTNLGMKVDVKTFEIGNLNQEVIRPRKYDALLFGEIINDESDLLAFWHSSQRKDPGLNVAMYTNVKVDKILETAFVTTDEEARNKLYVQFKDAIKKDMPAVFLYSPDFIYAVSKNLQGLAMDRITSPADRFLNVYSWYSQTDNVWKIFAPKK